MKRKYQILTIVMSGIIILDQISKFFIQQTMDLHQSRVIIDGFFNLTYILNPGAAFGFLADQNETFRIFFLMGIGFLAVSLVGYYFIKSPENAWGDHLSFSLILGGAFGNLLDRMRIGAVVDFLDFYIDRYHWPAFNVADSAISIGLALLMVLFFTREREKKKNEYRLRESS